MRITQEEFNKLPQLDRIEFRQKEDRIKERFSPSCSLFFFDLLIKILIFYFLVGLSGLFVFGKVFFNGMMEMTFALAICIIFIYMICFIFDIIIIIKKNKKLKELDEEYFKINIKKK